MEEYVLGRLAVSDLPAFEEHFMICTACRDQLDSVEAFAFGMKQALKTSAPVSKRASAWAYWFLRARQPAFSMALALVAMVASISIFSSGRTKFAPVATLQLTASRGEMSLTVAARELDLTLSDAPGVGGPFRVEVVNGVGQACMERTVR